MRMDFTFQELSVKMDVQLTQDNMCMEMDFGEVYEIADSEGIPMYEGSYEVTPKVEGQIFPTAQKLMAQNMTVLAIPYAEVSNTSNGTTVTIG